MRIAMLGILPQVALAAALVVSTSAHGADSPSGRTLAAVASFDCARATSAREKTICADPALSALDGKLGRLYAERRGLLSPAGAKSLQESERSWLRFVGTVCASDGPENKPWMSRRSCLTREYNERIEQLQTVAQRVGPFVFNRVDLYAAEPAPDENGASTGFYVQHVAYPQIDNATSPVLIAWNRQNVQSVSKEGDCDASSGDYGTDYEVGYANTRVVSVRWQHSSYCHGTPHGFGGFEVKNTMLLPGLRSMSSTDVFGAGDGWAPTLKQVFWIALTQTGWSPVDNADQIKRELEDDFIQPARWLFTKDGLQVAFSSYEGGCYACTPQPVTVPWSALKPLLSKSAVVP